MSTTNEVASEVRAVTEEESAFFFEHGWVRLRGFISPQLAGEMLEAGKRIIGAEGDQHSARDGVDFTPNTPVSTNFRGPSHEEAVFRRFITDERVGRNVAQILGRDTPIRLIDDTLIAKLPSDEAGTRGAPTLFHQDGNRGMTFDVSMAALWVALDEMKPEQGAMNFFDRSYQLGTLGRWDLPRDQVLEYVPQLARCEITETPHMQPGDATIHHGLTVHGAPANTGTSPRWAYRIAYLPGDARFSGLESGYTRGLGLSAYDSIEGPQYDEQYPLIYTPEGWNDGNR